MPLHLYRLATRLPANCYEIRVISLADTGPVGQRLQEAGIPVYACNAGSAADLVALTRLWRFLRADPPDVLHSLLFHANIAARVVGPLAGAPVHRIVCEIQTAEVERRWHLPVDGLTCRLCRFEVGNSPSVIEHLHRHAHIPRSRLRCEWGAVDTTAIGSALPLDRLSLGVAPGEKLLLWTGRFDPVKGFEELLEACRILKTTHWFKLLLVGDGPYRPNVEQLVRDFHLEDQVLTLGQRQDIPNVLKTADLFAFCSRTEGLPNSLLEAMAAGLPCVTTDVPGCRDLVQHRKTGWIVGSRDPQAVAHGIATLLDTPLLAARLGAAAREWVCARADIQLWVANWNRLYMEIANSSGTPLPVIKG